MTQSFCTEKNATLYSTSNGATEKMFVPGGTTITFTLVVNNDETLVLSYNIDNCVHTYETTTVEGTCVTGGTVTYTCTKCAYSYTETTSSVGHNYVGGKCSACGDTKVVSVNGTFNDWAGANMTYGVNGYTYTVKLDAGTYQFKVIKDGVWLGNNGTIEDTTTKTSDIGWEFVDAGDCTLVATGGTYTFTFNFDTNMLVIEFVHSHAYKAGEVVAPTCTAKGYTVYTCPCGDSYHGDEKAALNHSYTSAVTKEATCTADGVRTFTCSRCNDSYTEAITKLGHDYKATVTAPGCTTQGYTTHTCSVCNHSYVDSYTDPTGHTFVDGLCECGKYALQHVGATLTLESEIKYNLYFTLNDPTVKLENVGLLTFLTEPSDATIDNASFVLNNLFYDSIQGYNALRTQGVPAKEMGDTMYLRLYATLDDGTVIYGKLIPYSAKTFATRILENSSDEALKNTVVALMNYGAEAQKLLGYKTDSLMNADIPAEYQDKQVPYSADLLDGRVKAEDAKVGSLIATEGAFTGKNAQVTLNGALAINYLFVPGKTVDNGKMTMYFWTASTYASVDVLTLDNADSTVDAVINGSYYQAVYEGIAAKEIDDTVYVLAVYESDGETCMSGVVSYSIEQFCRSQVTNGTANQALCEKLTIYSYYAKIYFNVD